MALNVVQPKYNHVSLASQAHELDLHSLEIQRLTGKKVTVLCTDGVLWVTQPGDPQDYILNKGDQFVASRRGVVLVQAMQGAACIIDGHSQN